MASPQVSPRRRGGVRDADVGAGVGAVPLIRAAALGWLTRDRYGAALAGAERKARVVREVLETEETYVRTLDVLVAHYEEPARALRLFKPHSHACIFSNVNILRNEHRLLLNGLRARRAEGSLIVSDVLLAHLRRDLYTLYCSTFEDGIAALQDERTPRVNSFLNNAQAASGLNIDLPALLIQPVQRLPRYRLLLLEIERATWAEHPDLPAVRAAITHTEALASCVDELLNERKRREALEALEKRLTGRVPRELAAARGRRLLHEGELVKVCRKGTKPRRFVLLSDVLLYGRRESPPGERVLVSMALPLAELRVEEAPDPLPGLHHALRLLHPLKSFVALAPDAAARADWLALLARAADAAQGVASNKDRSRAASEPVHAAVWVPDEAAPLCQRCAVQFSLVQRRHHCRYCGACVCNDCSKRRWRLPQMGADPQRVCEACFRVLSIAPSAFSAAARTGTDSSPSSPLTSPRGPHIVGSGSAPTSPVPAAAALRWSPRGPSHLLPERSLTAPTMPLPAGLPPPSGAPPPPPPPADADANNAAPPVPPLAAAAAASTPAAARLSPQSRLSPRGPALHPALADLERARSGSGTAGTGTVTRRGLVIRTGGSPYTSPQQERTQPPP